MIEAYHGASAGVAALHFSPSLRLLLASFSDAHTLLIALDDPAKPPTHVQISQFRLAPEEVPLSFPLVRLQLK